MTVIMMTVVMNVMISHGSSGDCDNYNYYDCDDGD
jgi:hypothetical protein